MSKHYTGKYFILGLLSVMLAGPVHGQHTETNRQRHKNKSEKPVNGSVLNQTMTHKEPVLGVKMPTQPARKKFQFGHASDSFCFQAIAGANMTPDNLKGVFSPVIVAQPFVRISNRYSIGVHADIMIHNYSSNISHCVREMYLDTDIDTEIGHFGARLGRIPIFDETKRGCSKYMPVCDYLLNSIYLERANYFPRAGIMYYDNNTTMIILGYAEYSNGFGFSGNGNVIMEVRQKMDDDFQIGGMVAMGQDKSWGNVYLTHLVTARDAVLFDVLDIGNSATYCIQYSHIFGHDIAAISLNGILQSDDGVCGANVGYYHIPSGTYIATGATYHNPMNSLNPDGTPNDDYDKWMPFVEIGIKKNITSRNSR